MFGGFRYIWNNLGVVTKNLLLVNFVVWLAMAFTSDYTTDVMLKYGALHYFSSPDFLPSQLFTYMFMHEGFAHLFFNMFALFMFGGVMERTFGSGKFLFYYVSCGLGAALIQEGVFAIMIHHYMDMLPDQMIDEIHNQGSIILHQGMNYRDPIMGKINMLINIPTLGASGAIYGVLLAFGYIFPRRPMYLMFIPVPIQARWMVLGYGVIELLQAISNNQGDNTAHLAHLGGMVIGLLILIYWNRKGVITRYPY